jgi:DNA-binding IclR family transcriptional regulator
MARIPKTTRVAAGESRYNVRALERGLNILRVLADGRAWKLSDISAAAQVSNSTTFRLLSTLASFGFVERDEHTGSYRLGLACLELARAYHDASDIRRQARPVMEDLRNQTKETVHLAVLDGWDVVYLEKLQGLHAIGMMSSSVGGRSPSHCTGLGKVLLAHLDLAEVRAHFEQTGLTCYTSTTITDVDALLSHLQQVYAQGYALDLGEHESEVHCLAVPVQGMDGRTLAAISVSGPSARIDAIAQDEGFVEAIKEAARQVSGKLGHTPR